MARALARLTPGDRETLLLYAWADLSYQEIGDALAIPIGTVRSRIHRARQQVHEILAASGSSLPHAHPDTRTEGGTDGRPRSGEAVP